MTINPPETIKCPSCQTKQRRTSLRSGNLIGAIDYTDGKRVAPMLPAIPRYVKCPKCGVFFKITESVIYKPTRRNVPYVEFLSVDEYRAAINTGLYNAEPEGSKGWKDDVFALRLELWRAFNDRIRNGGEDGATTPWNDPDEKAAYEENCRELLAMTEGDNGDLAYIMHAELLRNLGELDECGQVLRKVAEPEKYEDHISAINEACKTGNTLTTCL